MPENGETCSVPPKDAEKEPPKNSDKKRVTLRISLFFDGTGNNRANTNTKRKASEGVPTAEVDKAKAILKEFGADPGSSYHNDHSNVSRLETRVEKDSTVGYDHYICLYIEGIGTVDAGKDTQLGYIMGYNSPRTLWSKAVAAGVLGKVDKGLQMTLAEFQNKIPSDVIVEKVSIDTFGFSRGSAAARYCIYRILHEEKTRWGKPKPSLKQRMIALGREVEKVEVRTVGLFDTVSSFGNAYVDESDVPTLHLDAVREAKQVFHIAAAEEYRFCFSLTNINSAKNAGKGWEIFLPGAHSDIGGGYVDGAGEKWILMTSFRSKNVWNFMREQGWYEGEELKYCDRRGCKEVSTLEHVHGQRAVISNEYSFLPLRAMADFIQEQEIPIDKDALFEDFNPVNIPSGIRGRIESYAAARGPSTPSDWHGDEPELRDLRHRFLHMSSRDATGHVMRIEDNPKFGDRFKSEAPWRRHWDG